MATKKRKKETTAEDLALMIGKGFAGVDKQFEQVDKQFEQVDKRLDAQERATHTLREEMRAGFELVDRRLAHVDARLDRIEKDIQEIDSLLVPRDEFDDLMARMKYVEMKLGIESGK